MTPIKLRLKGFKGIKAGQNKDEIELEFPDVKGKIAIIGANGVGKSTILQNMHPYILMPDRVKTLSEDSFSYYDECYLEDSEKELVWRSFKDTVFKSLIQINPIKKRTKAYLYIKENNDFTIVKETAAGNVEDYNREINRILGSAKLFFTSVFRSQNNKSIHTYTKGELEDVFSEILSLDKLQDAASRCSIAEKTIKKHMSLLEIEEKNLEKQVNDLPEIEQKLIMLSKQATDLSAELSKTKEEYESTTRMLAQTEEKLKTMADLFMQKKNLESDLQTKKKTLENISDEKNRLVSSRTKEISNLVAQGKNLKESITNKTKTLLPDIDTSKSSSIIEGINHECNKIQTEIQKQKEILNKQKKTLESIKLLEKERQELQQKINLTTVTIEKEKTLIDQKSKTIDKAEKLITSVPCNNTPFSNTCPLLKDTRGTLQTKEDIENRKATLIQTQKEIDKLNKELDSINQKIEKANQELADVNNQIGQYNKLVSKYQELKSIETMIEQYKNLHEKTTVLSEELKTTATQMQNHIESLQSDIQQLELKIKEIPLDKDYQTLNENYKTLKEKHQALQTNIKTIEKNIENTTTEIGVLNAKKDQISNAKEKIYKIKKCMDTLNKDINEWTLIKKAVTECIPLEIEDAGPAIAEIANKILDITYDGRFKIAINTQKITSKDPKSTLEILVYDTEGFSEPKHIKYLSGGERVWIEEAVTRAMVLHKQMSAGIIYDTLFSDEKDGALDEENRIRYMRLKNEVLNLGGFKREYFISHSKDAIAEADYVIKLD